MNKLLTILMLGLYTHTAFANDFLYKLMEINRVHTQKNGTDAMFQESTYDDALINSLRDLCNEIKQYDTTNNLNLVATPQNTDFINTDTPLKNLDCKNTQPFNLFMYNLAFAQLIKTQTVPKTNTDVKTATNNQQQQPIQVSTDQIIKSAKIYCENSNRKMIISYTTQEGYNKTQQTKTDCKMLNNNKIHCVTSGIHSNSRNQTRMYANCCIIEHHGGNSYGMSENSPNLKIYNNANNILTLSDFDEECNKN